jgi:hypothetical protein
VSFDFQGDLLMVGWITRSAISIGLIAGVWQVTRSHRLAIRQNKLISNPREDSEVQTSKGSSNKKRSLVNRVFLTKLNQLIKVYKILIAR